MPGRVKVLVDGRELEESGLLMEGKTYLPVRAVAEALGCTVDWNADTLTASITPGPGGWTAPEPADEGWHETIPQRWVDEFEALEDGWLQQRAPGLLRICPEVGQYIREVAMHVRVSEKLLVTRMELEQSAISYAWDGSRDDYGGGHDGDQQKLRYLCGVDKTDGGERENGWFGAKRQLLGCALRFKYWYRGINPSNPQWHNWLGLVENPKFARGVAFTKGGETIVPANQASGDCLQYTPHIYSQHDLRTIGMRWFAEDYGEG